MVDLSKIENLAVLDSFMKAESVFAKHEKICVSISGGSDSDIILDICEKIRKPHHKVMYVFFDTGIEYKATKDHLDYLEKKYGITIQRERAEKPIPVCCKEFGQPFISKSVSCRIERLQKSTFKWEDKPYEILQKEYPDICNDDLKWWTNHHQVEYLEKNPDGFGTSKFDINRNTWLKEFLIANPPKFKVSSKCCLWAKKKPAKSFAKETKADLQIAGVRRAEGGLRSVAYKNCYGNKIGDTYQYRPIFWYTDADKEYYEDHFDITHSKCYTDYGFKRTGCCGCPYNRKLFDDLQTMMLFEPKLWKACNNIFKDTYEYTWKYREFQKEMKAKEKLKKLKRE